MRAICGDRGGDGGVSDRYGGMERRKRGWGRGRGRR